MDIFNEDRMAEFLKAVKEGRVQSFAEGDLLFDDGDTKLLFAGDVAPGKFGLTVLDAGGFSGLILSVADWNHIKLEVDTRIASLKGGNLGK